MHIAGGDAHGDREGIATNKAVSMMFPSTCIIKFHPLHIHQVEKQRQRKEGMDRIPTCEPRSISEFTLRTRRCGRSCFHSKDDCRSLGRALRSRCRINRSRKGMAFHILRHLCRIRLRINVHSVKITACSAKAAMLRMTVHVFKSIDRAGSSNLNTAARTHTPHISHV